jgi:hypothetical protein
MLKPHNRPPNDSYFPSFRLCIVASKLEAYLADFARFRDAESFIPYAR